MQPGAYGAPPGAYAPPPGGQPGYGGPAAPGQELAQAGAQFGAMAGGAMAAGLNAQPGAKPSTRNPVTTLLMCWGITIAVNIVLSIVFVTILHLYFMSR